MNCLLVTAQKETLAHILHQPSSNRTKIAQLQSLKSTLRTLLKRKNQQKIMQYKEPQQSKIASKENAIKTKENQSSIYFEYGLSVG